MHGSDRVPDLKRLPASLGLAQQNHPRERNGALHRGHGVVWANYRLTPPTLSERRFFANYCITSGWPTIRPEPPPKNRVTRSWRSTGRVCPSVWPARPTGAPLSPESGLRLDGGE